MVSNIADFDIVVDAALDFFSGGVELGLSLRSQVRLEVRIQNN